MHINIKSFAEPKSIHQHFIFSTEKDWKELGATYRKSTGDQFTGKKDETFITVNEDEVKFVIGLGEDPKDFDIQETAAKVSWNFRKKIKSQTTKLICMNGTGENLKPTVTGLYIGTYEYPFESKHPYFAEGFELIAETDAGALEAVAFEAKALDRKSTRLNSSHV